MGRAGGGREGTAMKANHKEEQGLRWARGCVEKGHQTSYNEQLTMVVYDHETIAPELSTLECYEGSL